MLCAHRMLVRRLAVAALSVATVALGLPVFVGAAAAAPASLTLSPQALSASAGTCAVFTITPGAGAVAGDTITVNIDEGTSSSTQDVDFCGITGTTTKFAAGRPQDGSRPASYDNGNTGTTRSSYTPGRSITNSQGKATSDDDDLPDDASNAAQSTSDPTPRPTTNPTGVDAARFGFDGINPIKVGVVGLQPGQAGVIAFVDQPGLTPSSENLAPGSTETKSERSVLTITSGGLPGTQQAADAVTSVDAEPEDSAATLGTLQTFDVTLRNESGDTVSGVLPVLRVLSGPNFATPDQLRNDCTSTDNSGKTTCRFQGRNTGVDSLVIYVNRTGGSAGVDAGEARDEVTSTTVSSGTAGTARYLDLQPETATTDAGDARTFVAFVTDAERDPVPGVSVAFSETGPGTFEDPDGVVTTDSFGRAVIVVRTLRDQTGTQIVLASMSESATDSELQAGTPPGAAAGVCSDSAVHQIVVAASPAPAPTASATATPRATATATATSVPSSSTSPGRTDCSVTPTVTLPRTTITATGAAEVRVDAPANSRIELLAYSQPSTTYRVVRTAVIDADGNPARFSIVPPTNTRLYAQIVGCTTDEPRFSRVLNVRTQLSLNVERLGERTYRFFGDSLPARRGGLIVSLYRVTDTGRQVLTAQARGRELGQPGAGEYTITRRFTGSGRFGFVVRTGQDLQNAPGSSNVRSLAVF